MTNETPILIQLVETVGKPCINRKEIREQYDPKNHDVMKASKRKMKSVDYFVNKTNPDGTVVTDKRGNPVKVVNTKLEEVNRISIPLQKIIVNRRVAFMNVGETVLHANPTNPDEERLLGMVKKMGEDNKLRYKENEVARRMQYELECAKLWYSEDVEVGYWGNLSAVGKKRMKLKILSPELGDELFPVFNGSGDMVYFGRRFNEVTDLTSLPMESLTPEILRKWGEKTQRFDIYTKEGCHRYIQTNEGWLELPFVKYSYGKIPVIYYKQNLTPWSDVQPIIDRLETLISNFADTNDYNGSPILVAKGKITGMSERGERGKTFQIEGDNGDLKYVTWEHAPASIKLEIETLVDFIYTCTQTPNISFKEMKGLGSSGIAIDRSLIDAHLAARAVIDDVYGECTQRDINFRKAAAVAIDTSLEKVKSFDITFDIPRLSMNDLGETITNYTNAIAGGLLSRETAIAQSGLVDDAKEEVKKIDQEAKGPSPERTEVVEEEIQE